MPKQQPLRVKDPAPPRFKPGDSQAQVDVKKGANEKMEIQEYNDYIQELYKVINAKEIKAEKQNTFEQDLPNAERPKSGSHHSSEEEATELNAIEEEEDDNDQDEEELEKLRPQIELDVTAVQDRDDDPSFENDSAVCRPKEASGEPEEVDAILELLQQEENENLETEASSARAQKQEQLPPEPELSGPLSLSDFKLVVPEPLSEQQQKSLSLDFFRQKLMQDFNFKSDSELNRALNLIRKFEVNLQQSDQYTMSNFDICLDRFNDQHEHTLVNELQAAIFSHSVSGESNQREAALQFLIEASSFLVMQEIHQI